MKSIRLRQRKFNLELSKGIKLASTKDNSKLKNYITRTVAVVFNNTCAYNTDKKDEPHVLTGFTYNGAKVYVGWNYQQITRDIELRMYLEHNDKYYATGTYQVDSYVGRLILNKLYFITLTLDLTVPKVEVIIENSKTSYPITSSLIIRPFKPSKYGVSVSLGPRLGKMMVNPESKMIIKLEEL